MNKFIYNKLKFFSPSPKEPQNKLLLELTESILKRLNEMSASKPFIESAPDLYALWLEVNANFEYWGECDLILACPTTLRGAIELFKDKKVIEIKCLSTLKNFFVESRGKRYESIGIVSPEILKYLYDDQTLLLHLVQICQWQVVILTSKNSIPRGKELKSLLHKIGFYEILLIDDNKNLRCSTVGHMVGDSFDVQSNVPGLPNSRSWATHVASRTAMPQRADLPWWTVFGFLEFTENETRNTPGQWTLSIKRCAQAGESVKEQLIKGTLRWNKYEKGLDYGHVSLVGCYAGPGDTNMYAAMFKILQDKAVSISLLRNDGEWTCLEKTITPIENNPQDARDNSSFPLWLKITDSSIIVGTEDKVLLSQNDNKLQRLPTVGLRIFDNHISISDVTTNIVRE